MKTVLEHSRVILAVDPGDKTGLAYGRWDGEQKLIDFGSLELPTWEAIDWVTDQIGVQTGWDTNATFKPDLIVCENFTLLRTQHTWQPSALHSIGALIWITRKFSIPFELQMAGDAKRFSKGRKLSKMNWNRPTPGDHQNDAARHLLLAGVRHQVIDPMIFLKEI